MQLVLTIVAIFITYSISEVVRLQNGQDSFVVDSVTGERLGGRRNKQSVASQMDELLLHEHTMKSNAKRQFLESKDKAFNTLHKVKHGKKQEIVPLRLAEDEFINEEMKSESIGSIPDEVEAPETPEIEEKKEEIVIHLSTETFFDSEENEAPAVEAFRIESE